MFTAALFTIAKLKNHLRHRSTDEWIKKMCIYSMDFYSVINKNEIMSFVGKLMELEIMM
jgi:hypothetical protein